MKWDIEGPQDPLAMVIIAASVTKHAPQCSMAGPRKVLHAVAQPRPPQNYKVSVGEECQVPKRSWSRGLIVLPSKTALGARWKGWLGAGGRYCSGEPQGSSPV